MTDGRDRLVVSLRIEGAHARAQRFPEPGHGLHGVRLGPVGRGHDHRGRPEEIRPRDAVAAPLGARHRVASHEGERPSRGEPIRDARDSGLRRADVRHDGAVGRRPPDARQERLDRQDRDGEEDEVGVAHTNVEVGGDAIEGAVTQRRAQARLVATHAHDLAHQLAGAGRLGDRSSEEPDADDREPLDHTDFFPSTVRSALTSFRFSSGVPTVMRSAVSMPNGVMGRTITPSWRSFW